MFYRISGLLFLVYLLKDLFRDQAVIKGGCHTACTALVSEQMCPGIGDHLEKPQPPGRTSCPPKTGA